MTRNYVCCHLATCSVGHIMSRPLGRPCVLLIKEEVHLFEQKDCSPGDPDAGSSGNWAPDRTKTGRFIMAKPVQCNSFLRRKDGWLGSRGSASSNMQMREAEMTR